MNTIDEIMANPENISLEANATIKTNFCDIWPNAKQGLELLKDIVKNPVVKLMIKAVIAVGDVVCNKI